MSTRGRPPAACLAPTGDPFWFGPMSTMAQLRAIIFGVLAFALLLVTMAQPAGKTEIVISGTPDHGVFDPSIARSDSGRLYMSLSGVSSTAAGGRRRRPCGATRQRGTCT